VEQPLKFGSANEQFDVQIDTSLKLQTIEGFGACFNELAFQNPDDSIVLIAHSGEEREFKIKIGTKVLSPKLKAGSFNTLLISL
jgi:O-glycosyl hydrolase